MSEQRKAKKLTTVSAINDIELDNGHRVTLFSKTYGTEILTDEFSVQIYQKSYNVVGFHNLTRAKAMALFHVIESLYG